MRILRYVGLPHPTDADYRDVLEADETAVIDSLPGNYNVTVTFERDGSPVHVPLRDEMRDALDIAVTSYIGDELIAREASADGWTRLFDLVLPVKDQARWTTAETTLRRTLTTLSGDGYR